MIHTSEQIDAISAALVKAQAEIENVAKDRENPHFRAKYATLAGVLDEARPKFAKHGIYIMQAPINGEGSNIGVVTRLLHSTGQFIESTLFIAPMKFDAQGAGSALTYLRRYALMAMAGIAPEDDDGNAAVSRPEPQRAGMVRAADVPRNDARPLAAEPAANGKAAISTEPSHTRSATGNGKVEHPKRQEALDAYAHISKHLKEAKTPAAIEDLIKVNGKDLALVKEVRAESYEQLMRAANARKAEMYGETG